MERILRGTSQVIQNTFYMGESPTDSTVIVDEPNSGPIVLPGTVTIEVLRDDGEVLVPAGTATSAGASGDGTYEYRLLPEHTSRVDILTVRWTASFSEWEMGPFETRHEIVGGFYFTITDARASDPALASTSKYTTAQIAEARVEIEDECETICGVAFVRRYHRQTISGRDTDTILLNKMNVRRVISVTVDGTAYTEDELGALVVDAAGRIVRPNGLRFPTGNLNVDIAVEHGYDEPPSDVRRAALTRLKHRLFASHSGIPDRATSFVAADGGNFTLATPGRGSSETGVPDVDAVYARHNHRVPVVA